MGRPKKPSQLKVLEGGRVRADRDDLKNQAQPAIEIPPCPAWLDTKSRKHWDKVAPQLQALGLLSVIDGDILASYSETATRYGEVCEKLDNLDDWVQITPNGFHVQAAMVNIRNTLQKQMIALAKEFGMTPAARSSIKVETKQPDLFANEFNEFSA